MTQTASIRNISSYVVTRAFVVAAGVVAPWESAWKREVSKTLRSEIPSAPPRLWRNLVRPMAAPTSSRGASFCTAMVGPKGRSRDRTREE